MPEDEKGAPRIVPVPKKELTKLTGDNRDGTNPWERPAFWEQPGYHRRDHETQEKKKAETKEEW